MSEIFGDIGSAILQGLLSVMFGILMIIMIVVIVIVVPIRMFFGMVKILLKPIEEIFQII